MAALRQGILYVWQYGAYEDGNLHETDYDYMIQGITYQQPELLQKDAQIYQNMVKKDSIADLWWSRDTWRTYSGNVPIYSWWKRNYYIKQCLSITVE